MLRKRGLIILFLLLVSILAVSCSTSKEETSLTKLLEDVFAKVVYIGKLGFLGEKGEAGSNLIGFMRILVAVLVFTILFELGRLVLPNRNITIVIAGVISIISAIFIPGSILIGIGAAYGTIVALVMIGIPVLGGGYAIYRIPSTSRGYIVLKLSILVILLWILFAVRDYALSFAGVV